MSLRHSAGAALVAGGFAAHAAFAFAPGAGRPEAGQFAYLEAVLFAAGLALALPPLSAPPPDQSADRQAWGWLAWSVAALAAAFAVLWRLPS